MYWNIESLFSKDLDSHTIEEIYKVEQDMWARENGVGEYIVCYNCQKISSKEEVYQWLEKQIKRKVVSEIEVILSLETIVCPDCLSWNTRHVRWEECKNHIKCNLALPESFCTVMRGNQEKVVGFMYWYVADFQQIYESEFKEHFSRELESIIFSDWLLRRGDSLLSLPSVGTDEDHMSMFSMLKLMKHFFACIPSEYDSIVGITEVAIWGTMTGFYKSMWAYSLNVPLFFPHILNTKYNTIDILLQSDIVKTYKDKLSDMRTFLYTLKNNREEANSFSN